MINHTNKQTYAFLLMHHRRHSYSGKEVRKEGRGWMVLKTLTCLASEGCKKKREGNKGNIKKGSKIIERKKNYILVEGRNESRSTFPLPVRSPRSPFFSFYNPLGSFYLRRRRFLPLADKCTRLIRCLSVHASPCPTSPKKGDLRESSTDYH